MHRRYGAVYTFEVVIDLDGLGLSPESWLLRGLSQLYQSAVDSGPLSNTYIYKINVALRSALTSSVAVQLARLPLSILKKDDLNLFFREFEGRLALDDYRTKAAISNEFRRFCWAAIDRLGGFPRLNKKNVGFRSRFVVEQKKRKLLGDFSEVEPPLGATRFLDHNDLKAKIKKRAQAELDRIQDALIEEIENGERLRKYLDWCSQLPIDIKFLIAAQFLVTRKTSNAIAFRWVLDDLESYIGAVVLCIRCNALAYDGQNLPDGLRFSEEIYAHIFSKIGATITAKGVIFSTEFGLADEINAAALLLQCRTGWNYSSIVSLDSSSIKMEGDEIVLQGHKSKTDSDTPPYFVAREDVAAHKAISLLLWNHQRLILLGHKPPHDGRLWWACKAYREDGLSGPQHYLQKLIRQYKLPKFSVDMLRRQRLFIEGLRSEESARMLAGHQSLATTTVYLDNDVAFRLNSSINLKMQRQLEHEILYAMGERSERPKWALMLQPIGDGSSCINPNQPPKDYEMDGDLCRSMLCHAGDGCPNNKIVIDRDRMLEALMVRDMYALNWKRMHARNPLQFAIEHIPSMLFNAALLRLINVGPHGHILREIENDIEREK